MTWDFPLTDENGYNVIGQITRNFSGFAREIFTDTGVYALNSEKLGLKERAVMLGCAMNADVDYFSRHSSY